MEDYEMSTGIGLSPDVVSPAVQVDVGALSHPGKVRHSNEDHYLVVSFEPNELSGASIPCKPAHR
jgi:hypothetical protein